MIEKTNVCKYLLETERTNTFKTGTLQDSCVDLMVGGPKDNERFR